MKKFGYVIKTAFGDAQEKYCEQMSAAEGRSRQNKPNIKVRTDITNMRAQDPATRMPESGHQAQPNPVQESKDPAATVLPTFTTISRTPYSLKHQYHTHHIAHIHLTPNPALNPIGYLPTTKPTTCTICTKYIPIHNPALTHLNFYCAAWFHPSCLHEWIKGFSNMNWIPICPGCKRRVEGVGETPFPLAMPQREHVRDRQEVSEFEEYLRYLMKDKPVAGSSWPDTYRHLGGAIVDMDVVMERLTVLRWVIHHRPEGISDTEDEDEWEDEEVEDSD